MNTHVPVRPHTRRIKPETYIEIHQSLIDYVRRKRAARDARMLDHMAAMLDACVAESVAEYGED